MPSLLCCIAVLSFLSMPSIFDASGSYPFFREGKVGANFVIRSTEEETVKSAVDSLTDGLATNGYDFTPGGI